MAEEIIDKADDIIEEDLSKLDDSTDWKAKAEELEQRRREDGIRSRERTKALKEQLKTLETSKPPVKKDDKPEESALLQKLERLSLRQAGLTHQDDIELARSTAKKWNLDIDEVLADDDFKAKLERQQTKRSNELATSNIRGGTGNVQAKETTDYWSKMGKVPTKTDIPDRKTRVKIVREMMKNASTGGKTFYND